MKHLTFVDKYFYILGLLVFVLSTTLSAYQFLSGVFGWHISVTIGHEMAGLVIKSIIIWIPLVLALTAHFFFKKQISK